MGQTYFNRLNYTLANEDTALELALLPQDISHLVSIAGSGGRVLPLLARGPKRITCLDLAPEQLYLTELRFQSTLSLAYETFLDFWGYPTSRAPISSVDRKELFNLLSLSREAKNFLTKHFESKNWESILYDGKWENTFQKLSQAIRTIVGKRGLEIFDCRTLTEQTEYFRDRFPRKRWKLAILLLGNATMFNALLYRGHFPKKNIPEPFSAFYDQVFEHLFNSMLARDNFFLQLVFFGKIVFPEGVPIEAQPEVFRAAKKHLKQCQIEYVSGDAIEQIKRMQNPIGFVSLSDVPSYFSGDRERDFLQEIRPQLATQACVVIRNYLRIPENLDSTGYANVTEKYRSEISREKVGVYHVNIFEKAGHALPN